MNFRLHVAEGLHAGAEQALAPGQWLIGSGEHCDLVLLDEGVEREHVVLSVSDDAVRFRACFAEQSDLPRTSDLTVSEANPVGREVAPNQFDRYDESSVWMSSEPLVIGLATLRLRMIEASDTTATAAIESADRAGNPDVLRHDDPDVERLRELHRWPERKAATNWAGKLALGVIAVSLLLGIVAIQATRSSALASSEQKTPNAMDISMAKLRALNLPETELQVGIDGLMTISGWVRTEGELRRLKQAFSATPVQVKVSVAEEQLRFAQEYLAGQGQVAQVSYLANGVVRVSAAAVDELRLRVLIKRLSEAAPLLRGVELDHQPIAAPAPLEPPVVKPAPVARQVIAGIDGVSIASPRRFLTSGPHYIFEGGTLKDGSMIQSIESDQIALTPNAKTTEEVSHELNRSKRR